MKIELLFEDLTYELRGIFYHVHNELGQYRNEKQYCDRIEEFFRQKNIPYIREKVLEQSFPGEKSGRNRVDFIIPNKIIIEVKAVPSFAVDHFKQCKRYLVSTNLKLCLLVNFGLKSCTIKRILNPNNLR